jgi:hypothetical protein
MMAFKNSLRVRVLTVSSYKWAWSRSPLSRVAGEGDMFSLNQSEFANTSVLRQQIPQFLALRSVHHLTIPVRSFRDFLAYSMARAASRDKGEGPSTHNTRKKHQKKPYDSTGNDGSNVPGVQKIKSAIRQTKRLLAKVTYRIGFNIHVLLSRHYQ